MPDHGYLVGLPKNDNIFWLAERPEDTQQVDLTKWTENAQSCRTRKEQPFAFPVIEKKYTGFFLLILLDEKIFELFHVHPNMLSSICKLFNK